MQVAIDYIPHEQLFKSSVYMYTSNAVCFEIVESQSKVINYTFSPQILIRADDFEESAFK